MNDVDVLIKEKLVPLRKRAVDALIERHPHIMGTMNKYLAGKNNKVGLRVTENGATVGDYTFHLNGLYIDEVESGVLSSELHHPMGVIKPYGIMEKNMLERLLDDEQGFINEPFATIKKYMPDITIKFLR